TPLAPGIVTRLQSADDSLDLNAPGTDFSDSITQSVPLPMLGLSSSRVPIGIRAIDTDTGLSDEASFVFTLSELIGPGAVRGGFDASTLPGNDDGSTGLVPIGFPINFFGHTYTGLFVNNNGNLTLDQPLATFTPFPLTT